MTDTEIIKALKIHTGRSDATCKECVFYGQDYCRLKIVEAALDLINRQKAEIERLKYNLEAVLNERADHSEAIKEFAERLKMANTSKLIWFNEDFDNLVKEKVGDT